MNGLIIDFICIVVKFSLWDVSTLGQKAFSLGGVHISEYYKKIRQIKCVHNKGVHISGSIHCILLMSQDCEK